MNRGNRREAIFRTGTDRRRLLGRLAELPERFRTEVHAFVLMDNHCHLLLRTRDANLSDAIRRLQVSYSGVFNRAHRIGGQAWTEAVNTHGKWLRDAVLYTAARHLGYRLAEVDREIPGLRCPAAAQAVKRFGQRQSEDEARERFVRRLRRALGP